MCDGIADETTWTIKHRLTGQTVEGSSGFSYLFTEEGEALAFLQSLPEPASLEVVAIPVPEI